MVVIIPSKSFTIDIAIKTTDSVIEG